MFPLIFQTLMGPRNQSVTFVMLPLEDGFAHNAKVHWSQRISKHYRGTSFNSNKKCSIK
jgi:hypothetical protein